MKQVRVQQGQRSVPVTVPAPVGGLNGRDALANMPANDAFVLDNWFPENSTVNTRNGNDNFTTAVGAAVESIEAFSGNGLSRMLQFAGGKVFAVTGPGAAPAPLASGRTSNIISTAMFSNAGAQYLLGVSGADAPFSYDGTTFNNLAITGLTGSQNTLHGICAFKGRVYLAQKDQLGFYYLAVGAIQGAASYFDLAQVAGKGGYVVGIASFSMADSGVGPQDYMVFMTSEGEYIVYAGTDPSNAATWALVGRYYSSAPIGRRGWFKFRSDLYVISEEGIVAMAQIRADGEDGQDVSYLSSKLGNYLTELNPYQGVHGWCAVLYPKANMLIVNVPASPSTAGEYYQFVMNTTSGAWARFRDQKALCWVVYNKRVYYGTADGRVVLADEGEDDNGEPIKANARQAFNYFDDGKGMGAADKQFHFATLIVEADGTPPLSAELNVNFQNEQPDYVGELSGSTGTDWDVGFWDTFDWGGVAVTQNLTIPLAQLGYVASLWLRSYSTAKMKWFATRYVMERARGIVL